MGGRVHNCNADYRRSPGPVIVRFAEWHHRPMPTRRPTLDFICEQSGLGSRVRARAMFGEYALYLDGKVVGLVCDDTLFVKPTEAGRALLGTPTEAPPYEGAKPHFCIRELLDDREGLQALLLATAAALPAPKPRVKAKAPKDAPGGCAPPRRA